MLRRDVAEKFNFTERTVYVTLDYVERLMYNRIYKQTLQGQGGRLSKVVRQALTYYLRILLLLEPTESEEGRIELRNRIYSFISNSNSSSSSKSTPKFITNTPLPDSGLKRKFDNAGNSDSGLKRKIDNTDNSLSPSITSQPKPMGSKLTKAKELIAASYNREPSPNDNGYNKFLIFCEWTEPLLILAEHLLKENMPCHFLVGLVPFEERVRLRDKLNIIEDNEVRILLVTPQVGGEGITLTGANHVIMLNPVWNPQVDKQCIGRVLRHGQTRPVQIFRIIVQDSLEGVILNAQARKTREADDITDAVFKAAVAQIK
jgi:SNF2 family DNA or RNA helicase